MAKRTHRPFYYSVEMVWRGRRRFIACKAVRYENVWSPDEDMLLAGLPKPIADMLQARPTHWYTHTADGKRLPMGGLWREVFTARYEVCAVLTARRVRRTLVTRVTEGAQK